MVPCLPGAERLFEALRELVAIQSVSPDATRADDVLRAACWAGEKIRRIGGDVYGKTRVTTGVAGQHSGLYGGAALLAGEALVKATSALLPGVDGRLPPSLRVDAVSASEAERERWRGVRPGHELLAQAGLRAADAAAARDFHQRTRGGARTDDHRDPLR
jgi:hypothetical protein